MSNYELKAGIFYEIVGYALWEYGVFCNSVWIWAYAIVLYDHRPQAMERAAFYGRHMVIEETLSTQRRKSTRIERYLVLRISKWAWARIESSGYIESKKSSSLRFRSWLAG